MKRNKDLIRDILLYAEAQNKRFSFKFEGVYDDDCGGAFEGYKTGDVAGHFKLLIDDDYFDGKYIVVGKGYIYSITISSITMKGHDLLDSIRDKGVWAEIKKEIGISGDSWSLDILGKLAGKVIAKKLGLQ